MLVREPLQKASKPYKGSGQADIDAGQVESRSKIGRHSFAQRVQYQPCTNGQWLVKGAALAVLGDRKGAILPPRMTPFHAVKGGKSMTSRRQ